MRPGESASRLGVKTKGYNNQVFWRLILVCVLGAGLAAAESEPGQETLRRAVELHQSGHYSEAIGEYRTYLRAHPEAAEVRSNLGAALAHEGRYGEAIQEYTLALKAQPANVSIRFNLGLAYYKTGDITRAVKEFEAVYAALPADDSNRQRLILLLSECYLRQGEEARVVALLNPVADRGQEDPAADYLLGTALLHQGQDERGAMLIERLLRHGDTAEVHMLMAYTRMKANDSKGALGEIDRALALNPNLAEAYCLRGRLEFIVSDMDGAEKAFRKALELAPNSFDALFFLGTLLREQGRLPEAHTQLQRAVELRPKEIGARYQFALEYSSEGDDKRAAELLESLIKSVPDYTEAHRSLSTIYFRLGRAAEGREERKIAETLDAQIQAQDQQRGRSLKK